MHNLTVDQISTFITRLVYNFESQSDEKNQKDSQKSIQLIRSRVLEQLSCLIKNPKIPREESWMSRIIQFLCIHGLFKKKQESNADSVSILDSKTRLMCLEKLNGILCSQFVLSSGKKTNGHQFSRIALDFIESLIQSDEYELVQSMDSDIQSIFKRVSDLIHSIQKRVTFYFEKFIYIFK